LNSKEEFKKIITTFGKKNPKRKTKSETRENNGDIQLAHDEKFFKKVKKKKTVDLTHPSHTQTNKQKHTHTYIIIIDITPIHK